MKVLSIDAWRDGSSWTWNAWYTIGTITKEEFEALKTARQKLAWFRLNNFLADGSKGKVCIDDDGYNMVVCVRGTGRPLFAIEYGPEY